MSTFSRLDHDARARRRRWERSEMSLSSPSHSQRLRGVSLSFVKRAPSEGGRRNENCVWQSKRSRWKVCVVRENGGAFWRKFIIKSHEPEYYFSLHVPTLFSSPQHTIDFLFIEISNNTRSWESFFFALSFSPFGSGSGRCCDNNEGRRSREIKGIRRSRLLTLNVIWIFRYFVCSTRISMEHIAARSSGGVKRRGKEWMGSREEHNEIRSRSSELLSKKESTSIWLHTGIKRFYAYVNTHIKISSVSWSFPIRCHTFLLFVFIKFQSAHFSLSVARRCECAWAWLVCQPIASENLCAFSAFAPASAFCFTWFVFCARYVKMDYVNTI